MCTNAPRFGQAGGCNGILRVPISRFFSCPAGKMVHCVNHFARFMAARQTQWHTWCTIIPACGPLRLLQQARIDVIGVLAPEPARLLQDLVPNPITSEPNLVLKWTSLCPTAAANRTKWVLSFPQRDNINARTAVWRNDW